MYNDFIITSTQKNCIFVTSQILLLLPSDDVLADNYIADKSWRREEPLKMCSFHKGGRGLRQAVETALH